MGAQIRTIAVIDDDLRVLDSLINLLKSFGYQAEGYGSAEEFLDSGGLQKSTCVITDVEMRQMSSLGLLHHINSTKTPVAGRDHHWKTFREFGIVVPWKGSRRFLPQAG